MRILALTDDKPHPAAVPIEGLGALGNGYQIDIVQHARDWSVERMAEYQVVLLAKMDHVSAADTTSWVDEAAQGAFVGFVRDGGGLLAVHGGTCYKDIPAMRSLLGGAFLHHPKQCPVTVEPVEGHPFIEGVASFTATDEHYHMALDDAGADVFLTSTSQHGAQPAGWTRDEGRGRVCVLTPGHNVEVWLHPSFQALLRSALHWVHNQE